MRNLPPLLAAVFVLAMPVRTWAGGGWYTPYPKYPAEMSATATSGTGMLKITIDDKGNITDAVMSKSTGSHFLDEYTALFVKSHWKGPTGQPQVHFTEFVYNASRLSKVTYFTPPPDYPAGPRESYVGRSCTVVVAFDERGYVVKAAIAKSTGNDVLDEHIKKFICSGWRSSGGRPAVRQMDLAFGTPAKKTTRKG